MKKITIIDNTLCRKDVFFTFKDKLNMARQLDKVEIDVLELPEITDVREDILLCRTASAFIKKSVISVAAGSSKDSIANAVSALDHTSHGRIKISLPLSPVGMEYSCHKKPAKMLEWISFAVAAAKKAIGDVEFEAVDATRAEIDFLENAVKTAVEAGASSITLCDSAAEMLPQDFASFVKKIGDIVSVPVYVNCSDKNGLSLASAVTAVSEGANGVKASIDGENTALEMLAVMIKNCGEKFGISTSLRDTEINRAISKIHGIWTKDDEKAVVSETDLDVVHLDKNDKIETVIAAASKIGYDLDEEDGARVYEEFLRVAEKKNVGAKELDAIVASVAMQAEPTYKLVTYSVTSSNALSSNAHIILEKNGQQIQGVGLGDGPISSAFVTMEQLIGRHFELADFQIKSVTEGKEAVGVALVKLKSEGKTYAGNGVSTDIIGASIRAYLGAVNKIVYEEN